MPNYKGCKRCLTTEAHNNIGYTFWLHGSESFKVIIGEVRVTLKVMNGDPYYEYMTCGRHIYCYHSQLPR